MINLNKPANSFTTGGGKKEKPVGYFVCKILSSTTTQSKNGHPMWVIECDIAEGKYTEYFKKYPLRWRQVTNNDVGQQIAATTAQRIVESNEGMIDPNIINGNDIDESAFTGLLVGAKLGTQKGIKDPTKDYSTVESFCSVQYAREHATDGSF